MNEFQALLTNSGRELYKKYLGHLLKKMSEEQVLLAIYETIQELPDHEFDKWMAVSLEVYEVTSLHSDFWNTQNLATASGLIFERVLNHFDFGENFKDTQDGLRDENGEVAFNVFLTISLCLVLAAHHSKIVRQHIGVRKGLFG